MRVYPASTRYRSVLPNHAELGYLPMPGPPDRGSARPDLPTDLHAPGQAAGTKLASVDNVKNKKEDSKGAEVEGQARRGRGSSVRSATASVSGRDDYPMDDADVDLPARWVLVLGDTKPIHRARPAERSYSEDWVPVDFKRPRDDRARGDAAESRNDSDTSDSYYSSARTLNQQNGSHKSNSEKTVPQRASRPVNGRDTKRESVSPTTESSVTTNHVSARAPAKQTHQRAAKPQKKGAAADEKSWWVDLRRLSWQHLLTNLLKPPTGFALRKVATW